MSYRIDSTGVPVMPYNEAAGILLTPPGNGDVFPHLTYPAARICADAICRLHPERRAEMAEYAKWANRMYLPHLLNHAVRKKIGFEAALRRSDWCLANLPKAERRSWERAQNDFQPWRDWP